MNPFKLIQHFFSRMHCHHCEANLQPDGIELLRQENQFFIVKVSCLSCHEQLGVAMVGLEERDGHPGELATGDLLEGLEELLDPTEGGRFPDPELTEEEAERLSAYEPVTSDDVIEAHRFFNELGTNWREHLPEQFQSIEVTLPETEDAAPTDAADLPQSSPHAAQGQPSSQLGLF